VRPVSSELWRCVVRSRESDLADLANVLHEGEADGAEAAALALFSIANCRAFGLRWMARRRFRCVKQQESDWLEPAAIDRGTLYQVNTILCGGQSRVWTETSRRVKCRSHAL
jgi:hypothetical protein